jgi:uncharacterized protein (UPF0332 family)
VFDGRAFLLVAERLLTDAADEAVARSVIGRAYYAVFHAGRAAVEAAGSSLPRGPAGHRRLGEHLTRIDPAIPESLERLRKLRNAADYDTHPLASPNLTAQAAFELARNLIVALDEFDGSGT